MTIRVGDDALVRPAYPSGLEVPGYVFVILMGLLVGGVIGVIVALFSGLIPIYC